MNFKISQRNSKFYHTAKLGFTLIELLVVIAIVGLLSSVVLASLNSARGKARDAKRVADMRQVQTALEFYYDANNSTYPSTDNDGCGGWDVGNQSFPFMTAGGVSTLGSFMSKPPTDPIATGNCSGYNYYRYPAGDYGCDASKGAYYVLMLRGMETGTNPHPSSLGWSCPDRNWQGEANWVTGRFEK